MTLLLSRAGLALGCMVIATAGGCGSNESGDEDAAPVDANADAQLSVDAAPPDAELPDARIGPDAACPAECSSCAGDGTCVIDCGAGECHSDVICPPGLPCEVNCIGDQACEYGHVDCTQATSCDIACVGVDACDYGVACGGATCTVVCDGEAACEDGLVSCGATTCDITCIGMNACAAGVCCDGNPCTDCTASGGGNCACL